MGRARVARVPDAWKVSRHRHTGNVCCGAGLLPMIVSRTPYRISFFGGGTDYPGWYRQHGGAVLATTIDKYCYITCRYLPPFHEHRFSIVYSKMEWCNAIDEIKHPAVREVLR